MKTRSILLATIAFGLASGLAQAQDQLVVKALTIIEQHEALEKELKDGDVAAANRYINGLNKAGKYLNAAYKKDTTHWIAASKRYSELSERLQAKAAATPEPAEEPKEEPKPKDEPKPKAEPKPRAEPKPKVEPTPAAPTVNKRDLDGLASSIYKAHHSLQITRTDLFADEGVQQRTRERIIGFEARLKAFPADDDSVKEVAAKLDGLKALLAEKLADVEANRAPAGAAERLTKLEEFYGHGTFPDRLVPPLEPDFIRAWATEIRKMRDESLPRDLAWVDSVRGKIGIEQQQFNRVRGMVGSSWPLRIRSLIQESHDVVYAPERTALFLAKAILETDPDNEHHVVNRILREGAFEQNLQGIQEGFKAVEIAQAYDEGLQVVDGPDHVAAKQQLEAALAHLRACVQTALVHVRMSKPASADPKLLAIAKEVLARPKYDAGKAKRLIINSDVKRKEKHEGSISSGTVYSTVTVYHYVWDEFQVTTAEKEGDQYWIYYNQLKYFHKGGSTTPTEAWILSSRFKTTPILEENIDK